MGWRGVEPVDIIARWSPSSEEISFTVLQVSWPQWIYEISSFGTNGTVNCVPQQNILRNRMFGVLVIPTAFTNPCAETRCYARALPTSILLMQNRIEYLVIIRNVYVHGFKVTPICNYRRSKRHFVYSPYFERKFRLSW